MTTYHSLTAEQFDRLATGAGGPEGVAALRTAQVSKHLLLIGYLLREWPGDAAERDRLTAALETARNRAPEAFAEVIGAPLVGAWTAITARAARHGTAVRSDFTHLAGLTAVACAAAGVDVEVEVPVRDGLAVLPGVGGIAAPGHDRTPVKVRNGQITTAVDQPVHYLTPERAGRRLRLALDDIDPYRHGHHAPPAPRLAPAELARWRESLDEAWQLLAELAPDRADELSAGLRTLVPLVQADQRSARSATIRHAFGVFGLTRPPTATDFAVTLVHEFQHSKLSAMLDLTPMTDPADDRRYFAPWRVDPRPLSGLLQGVYAFVGVADTWRALRNVAGVEATAEREFAEARLQVDRGLDAVERSRSLTPAGERLAARMRATTDRLLAEPVPPAVDRAAEAALQRIHDQWQARNN
jgi:HEXXH motif-containing protein